MNRANWLRWPWQVAALAAFYLPWIINPAAALTFNAYDLAEFTSLRPDVRTASIPLVVPFLLRAVLAGIALLCGLRALRSTGWVRWAFVALALVLAITLLPPPDFFRGALGDPNYRQQFAITFGTLIGLIALAAASVRGLSPTALRRIEALVALLALVFTLVGEVMAQGVVRSLQITAPLGVGVVVMVGCLALIGVAAWRNGTSQYQ